MLNFGETLSFKLHTFWTKKFYGFAKCRIIYNVYVTGRKNVYLDQNEYYSGCFCCMPSHLLFELRCKTFSKPRPVSLSCVWFIFFSFKYFVKMFKANFVAFWCFVQLCHLELLQFVFCDCGKQSYCHRCSKTFLCCWRDLTQPTTHHRYK